MKDKQVTSLILLLVVGLLTLFTLTLIDRFLTRNEIGQTNIAIIKGQREYKFTFTDGETSEVSCYVADLFDNGTQMFCADEDYEFMNIYGNIDKVEIIEK